jgi:hypothetical protein
MANQMIALQTRNPQLPDPAKMTTQYANLMGMAQQNETAKRQAMQAQQTMDINAAQEARAARIAEPQFAKAQSEATAADIKTAMDFNNFVRVALSNSDSPDQVAAFAERIASQPQFENPVYQGALSDAIASMPTEPAQFEAWKEKTALSTLEADKRYEQVYKTQTTGTEQREIAMPKYGRGDASEVTGSRFQVAQGMQYITDDQGNIRVVPKEAGGGFDTPAPAVGTPGRGSPVANALKTNPGALKDGAFAKSQRGYAGASGGFATFKTPEDGIAAQENLLRGSYVNKGFNTIDKIINRYAPQGPENSGASVSNYKKYVARKAGIDINAPISAAQIPAVAKAMREFETGNKSGVGTGTRTTATGEPPIIIPGSGAKGKASTEGERRFGTISRQMRTNLKDAVSILQTNPKAIRPSGAEYAASQIPFYGEEARLFAESEPRQQFVASVLRFLDNITFVNTGAGTSKEQEANYRRSYIPTYQDTDASAYRKLVGMANFAKNVKDAAGVMWTPELDADFNALTKAIEKLKPKGAAAPKAGPRTSTKRQSLENIFGG